MKVLGSVFQVKDTPTDSDSVAGLGSSVGKVVDQLKKQGLLSGETVGPMFTSVSNTLNGQSDESTKDERQKVTFVDHRQRIMMSLLRLNTETDVFINTHK